MLFEHIGPDGECKMQTTDPSCISIDVVEDTSRIGYRFKIDGKFVSKSNILETIKSLQNQSTKRTHVDLDTCANCDTSGSKNAAPAARRVSFKDLINKVG